MRISDGWLHGFTPVVWLVVALNVAGGLLVAVTIKYADNIIRGFAQAVAIIVGAVRITLAIVDSTDHRS